MKAPRPRAVLAFGGPPVVWPRLVLAASLLFLAPPPGLGLDAAGAARLKKAGVSDQTLSAMVRERSVETGAFSVEDILALKAAGVGEATLQMLITEGSFLKDRAPIVYGSDVWPLRLSTAADIIRLRQAGLGDDVLEAIVAAGRPAAETERAQALRSLEKMGLWIETGPR